MRLGLAILLGLFLLFCNRVSSGPVLGSAGRKAGQSIAKGLSKAIYGNGQKRLGQSSTNRFSNSMSIGKTIGNTPSGSVPLSAKKFSGISSNVPTQNFGQYGSTGLLSGQSSTTGFSNSMSTKKFSSSSTSPFSHVPSNKFPIVFNQHLGQHASTGIVSSTKINFGASSTSRGQTSLISGPTRGQTSNTNAQSTFGKNGPISTQPASGYISSSKRGNTGSFDITQPVRGSISNSNKNVGPFDKIPPASSPIFMSISKNVEPSDINRSSSGTNSNRQIPGPFGTTEYALRHISNSKRQNTSPLDMAQSKKGTVSNSNSMTSGPFQTTSSVNGPILNSYRQKTDPFGTTQSLSGQIYNSRRQNTGPFDISQYPRGATSNSNPKNTGIFDASSSANGPISNSYRQKTGPFGTDQSLTRHVSNLKRQNASPFDTTRQGTSPVDTTHSSSGQLSNMNRQNTGNVDTSHFTSTRRQNSNSNKINAGPFDTIHSRSGPSFNSNMQSTGPIDTSHSASIPISNSNWRNTSPFDSIDSGSEPIFNSNRQNTVSSAITPSSSGQTRRSNSISFPIQQTRSFGTKSSSDDRRNLKGLMNPTLPGGKTGSNQPLISSQLNPVLTTGPQLNSKSARPDNWRDKYYKGKLNRKATIGFYSNHVAPDLSDESIKLRYLNAPSSTRNADAFSVNQRKEKLNSIISSDTFDHLNDPSNNIQLGDKYEPGNNGRMQTKRMHMSKAPVEYADVIFPSPTSNDPSITRRRGYAITEGFVNQQQPNGVKNHLHGFISEQDYADIRATYPEGDARNAAIVEKAQKNYDNKKKMQTGRHQRNTLGG